MADPVGGTEPPSGEPNEAHLVRLHGDNRRPLLGAIITVAILALAVLKPWSGPGDASRAVESDARTTPLPGVAAASPGPAATPSATPPGYDAPGGQCFPGAGWRVFTVETRAGRRLRTWLAIEPAGALSPRDPAVPFVEIVTERLAGLGFCVRSGPDGPAPLAETRAWALTPEGSPVPVALAPLVAYTPYQPNLGSVYRPPTVSRGGAGEGWSPGRYVFAVRQGSPRGAEWWFGVEVVIVPGVPSAP